MHRDTLKNQHFSQCEVVRTAVAGKTLEGQSFETTLKLADDVFKAMTGPLTVATTTTTAKTPGSENQAVDAFKQTRGRPYGRSRGGYRGRGGRGGTGKPQEGQTQTVHPDKPPQGCCKQHVRYGRSSYYCVQSASCPWKSYVSPPVEKD